MNSSTVAIGLRMLDSSQIDKIHQASLDILARTGVVVRNDEAISLLKKAGANVDGERVRMSGRRSMSSLRPQSSPRITRWITRIRSATSIALYD